MVTFRCNPRFPPGRTSPEAVSSRIGCAAGDSIDSGNKSFRKIAKTEQPVSIRNRTGFLSTAGRPVSLGVNKTSRIKQVDTTLPGCLETCMNRGSCNTLQKNPCPPRGQGLLTGAPGTRLVVKIPGGTVIILQAESDSFIARASCPKGSGHSYSWVSVSSSRTSGSSSVSSSWYSPSSPRMNTLFAGYLRTFCDCPFPAGGPGDLL